MEHTSSTCCRRFGSYASLSLFMPPLARIKHAPCRLKNGAKRTNEALVNVVVCQQRRWSSCAASAVSAAAQQQPKAASVEYQVAGSTISVSLSGGAGNGMGHFPLLRLQERGPDSEYVLLLPPNVAEVLLEVLQRALDCVQTGNNGCPLELHHTLHSGNRTFKCSLTFHPLTSSSSSSSSSDHALQQQPLAVTVTEVGRSCVHLPVSSAVQQPVQHLISLLQVISNHHHHQQQHSTQGVAAAYLGIQQQGAAEQQPAGSRERQQASVERYVSQERGSKDEPTDPDGLEASNMLMPLIATEGSDPNTTTTTNTQPLDAAEPIAADGPADDPSSRLKASQVLFAAIKSSSCIHDGFTLAHAAAAEASGKFAARSSSSSMEGMQGEADGEQQMFQWEHMYALWQKLPEYAARSQRKALQLATAAAEDEETLVGTPLYPEVKQELQRLLDLLVPLLQPQLPQLPRHVLQRLLQVVVDARLQLGDSFLAAWAAAATAPPAADSWDEPGRTGLLKVTLLLLKVQGHDDLLLPAQDAVPSMLPLAWCSYALAEVLEATSQSSMHLQGPESHGDDCGLLHEDTSCGGANKYQYEVTVLLQQLVPLLLASCGQWLQQQNILWQSWSDASSIVEATSSSSSSTDGSSDSNSGSNPAVMFLQSVACSLHRLMRCEVRQQPDGVQPAVSLALQQASIMQGIASLSSKQQTAAVNFIWSWLGYGEGARSVDTNVLSYFLKQLPYHASATEHVATRSAASVGSSSIELGSSHLLAHLLESHVGRFSDVRSDGSACELCQQVSAVRDLVSCALDVDPAVAFMHVHTLLQALAGRAALYSRLELHETSAAQASSSRQEMDEALAELVALVQHMLQLAPQQLLQHSAPITCALAELSTTCQGTAQSIRMVLDLTKQLVCAADGWHAAAADPHLHQHHPETSEQHIPTAQELVSSWSAYVPAYAAVCMQDLQRSPKKLLPTLAEVLQLAATLHEQHVDTNSLAPPWLSSTPAQPIREQLTTAAKISTGHAPAVTEWQSFASLVQTTAAQSGGTPLEAADVVVAVSALLSLGAAPTEDLLQAYWVAVGPEALGLTAVGLQRLLWIISGILLQKQQQQEQQGNTEVARAISSSSRGSSTLLQLATKACSSIAVRSASTLSARQAARLTWSLSQLSSCHVAPDTCWRPPLQTLSWLRRVWQGMDVTASNGGSSSSWSKGAGQADLLQQLQALRENGVLHQQEVLELQSSLQKLLMPPAQVLLASPLQHDRQHLVQEHEQEKDKQHHQQDAPDKQECQQAFQKDGQECWQQQQQQTNDSAEEQQNCLEAATAVESADLHIEPSDGFQEAVLGVPSSSHNHPQQQAQQQQHATSTPQQQQQQQDVVPTAEQAAPHATERFEALQKHKQLLRARERRQQQTGNCTVHQLYDVKPSTGSTVTANRHADAAEEAHMAASQVEHSSASPKQSTNSAAQISQASTAAAPAACAPSITASDGAIAGAAHTMANAPPASKLQQPAAAAADQELAAYAQGTRGETCTDTRSASAAVEERQHTGPSSATGHPPSAVLNVLQQLQDPGFDPTKKQALQMLMPVQLHVAALPPSQLSSFLRACFRFNVPLSVESLLAAAHAVVIVPADELAGGGAMINDLVPGLISALADAISVAQSKSKPLAPSSAASQGSHTSAPATTRALQQQAYDLLEHLLPRLGCQQLTAMSAAELLQLLRDVYTCVKGSKPPKVAALPIGTALFSSRAFDSSSSSSSSSMNTSCVAQTDPTAAALQPWLTAVAAALPPKLLLLPYGSQLLESLQLLQALGEQQPGRSFMDHFLAAADALLDTLSGRNCLELLAAAAAAGQLPSKAFTETLLQHLTPLKLAPADVAAGFRLLAALGVRPSADLLLHWFELTQAAAEHLQPHQVVQVLWACCLWRVQPPSEWLHSILKGLIPAGRLNSCSAVTLASLCRYLWQLGVQPAPAFVAAVAAVAERMMTAAGEAEASPGKASGWQRWQEGHQHSGDTAPRPDAESMSMLCFCFLMWQYEGSASWRATVAQHAAAFMPSASGVSVLRLALYLQYLHQQTATDTEDFPHWQQALLQTLPQVLPADNDEDMVLTMDGAAAVPGIPAWALGIVTVVLMEVPEQSEAVLRRLVAAVNAKGEGKVLTAWDVVMLLPVHLEMLGVLHEQAEAAGGPLAAVVRQRLEQEAANILAAAEKLLKYAYQLREGAPADALAVLRLLAEQFGISVPQQSSSNLEQAETAARVREQQLQKSLLLQEQTGQQVPEDLLQGWAELSPEDCADVFKLYGTNPLQAALQRRLTWLGAAVGEDWVLQGLSHA